MSDFADNVAISSTLGSFNFLKISSISFSKIILKYGQCQKNVIEKPLKSLIGRAATTSFYFLQDIAEKYRTQDKLVFKYYLKHA